MKRPFWFPDDRQWVTIGLFGLTVVLLLMARENPALWEVKLFELLIQAIVITGLLNMVSAFHFSANKAATDADQTKAENTGKAFDALKAAREPQPVKVVNDDADPVPIETQEGKP